MFSGFILVNILVVLKTIRILETSCNSLLDIINSFILGLVLIKIFYHFEISSI